MSRLYKCDHCGDVKPAPLSVFGVSLPRGWVPWRKRGEPTRHTCSECRERLSAERGRALNPLVVVGS